MMKKLILPIVTLALISSCNVNKEEKGELPEVDVDIDGEAGNLPEYDVNWADVDVETTTKMVEVPKVVVVMEEEEVEVPVVDFEMPGEESRERSIVVEAEVTDNEHELNIREIRATQRRLYVISKLDKLDNDLGDQTMRVQDQMELNAPDLEIVHIIVGERAENVLNDQYRYVDTMDDLDPEIMNAQKIYSK